MKSPITVQTVISAPIETIWDTWTKPEHITKWAFAADDWIAPRAENDVRTGGKFLTRMEAKDGSTGFDFTGTYTEVEQYKKIAYVMDGDDQRKVVVEFVPESGGIKVTETFDPENENPEEMQRGGWQAILENFKKYVEGLVR